jgi:transposase
MKPEHRYAEAIVVAAQRPEMRFVPPKSEEQQARAVLYEHGHPNPLLHHNKAAK